MIDSRSPDGGIEPAEARAMERLPEPPRKHALPGVAVNHPHTTDHQAQRAEELVSWTGRERLRFLWYRLRLTVSEMNYAARRMLELRMRLP
jgi:hypothetical protein